MRALDTAATGMEAQQTNVDTISNNIANMNTSGYKRQRAEFQDLLYQNVRRVGSTSSDVGTVVPSGIQLGAGVETQAIYRVMEQGSLERTGNNLDLAINGKGFFQIEMPDGQTAYTRNGSFQLNQDGEIVTADGYTVQPGLVVPPEATDITINESGEVLANIDGQVEPVNVGQLELANFANEAGLEAIGKSLFLETQASGAPDVAVPNAPGFGGIQQGFVESSNVDMAQELTDMISAQRAYEMNSRVIQASDQMMQTATRLR